MNLITKAASRVKRYVCSGSRTMHWYKRSAWRAHRSRIKRDLQQVLLAEDYEDVDIIPMKRDEMCTSWEIF